MTTEQRGIVEAILPRALYKIRLNNEEVITAQLSGSAKHAIVDLIPGDQVVVQLSPMDPTKGRITATQMQQDRIPHES